MSTDPTRVRRGLLQPPIVRTTRENCLAVTCPLCDAEPNEPCMGQRGEYRVAMHAERHGAAVEQGYPRNPRWSSERAADA